MRHLILVAVLGSALAVIGCADAVTAPSPPAKPSEPPAPGPPGPFPFVRLGEAVRFRFTTDDIACDRAGGRCRSYNITVPSNGALEVVLASVSGQDNFIPTTEMYVVPGGDSWDVGPGPRISVTLPVRANGTYEIRMYSMTVPSLELELRTSLQ